MSKSTEEELSDLHGLLAMVLKHQLSDKITITDEESGVVSTIFTASPATIAAAIKFLKDNDITSSVADDENLGGLQATLDEMKKQRGVRLESVS